MCRFLIDVYRTVRYVAEMLSRYDNTPPESDPPDGPDLEQFSQREQEVLAAVLELMVEEGDGFSMAQVARRASCSKETLYRWFGDRDGLLTATVRWQASKVIMPNPDPAMLDLDRFTETLIDFAKSWLTVLTGDVSIALNRLAVAHAGNNKTNLGQIVLVNGPLAMRDRLLPIFEIGRTKGFIKLEAGQAFRLFFGLVVADTQIRCLLGDAEKPDTKQISLLAKQAVERLLALCADNSDHVTQTQQQE